MSNEVKQTIDTILIVLGMASAKLSTLDSIEQMGRIVLLFISILSGLLLIIINFDKAIARIKKLFR